MIEEDIDLLMIELIRNISKKELEIESLRQNINEMKEFEPFAVFTRIDRNRNRKIESNDIARFLQDNDTNMTYQKEIHLTKFIHLYDLNND